VSLILFVVAILLSPTTISLGNIPTSNIVSVVLIIVLVVGVGVALIFGVPLLRRKVLPPIESGAKTIWEAFRSPRRVLLLVVGNTANTIMYGFVMLTCVAAFGGHIDFWTVLALNIGVSTIASLVPIPGGGTAVGSIGMSGALTAVGVPTSIAVAAVLADQLVANFIPAVPGWFATNNLLHDDFL
jgi:undecaprenyl-diphosphatase